MDIAMIGSVSQYTRSMKMTMDWKQKEASGDYTKKADETKSEWDRYRQQMEDIRKHAAEDKSSIYTKLSTGKKLTAEEMDYLRDHDPEAYKKAKEIEAEQKSYEERLKRCRTKEEAERMRISYLSHKAAMAKEVANNPNIPKAQKMAILVQENAKIKAAMEADVKFKRSRQYAALPTEEEKAQEEKEKMEELRGEPQREEAIQTAEETEEMGLETMGQETEDQTQEKESTVPESSDSKASEHPTPHWITMRQSARQPGPDTDRVRQMYRQEAEADVPIEKKHRPGH